MRAALAKESLELGGSGHHRNTRTNIEFVLLLVIRSLEVPLVGDPVDGMLESLFNVRCSIS